MTSKPTTRADAGATAQAHDQFLTFRLADEEYGIPILEVQEIRGFSSVTPIPNAPAFVKGVMNLRGSIVPVYDLRLRFAMPAAEPTRVSAVIVVYAGSKVCGLLVDAVSDVVSVAAGAIEPPPDLGLDAEAAFLSGMFHERDRLVAVLDVRRVCDATHSTASSTAA